jgi:hypothetical protein
MNASSSSGSPSARTVARAYQYLKALAADPGWRTRGELPGVRTLARLSGFSHFTMWKALRRAAEAKLLIVEPGRRPRLPGAARPASPAPQAAGLPKWERLRLEIERDLLRGIYRQGEAVPSLKEMQGRYRVCYSTLRKALRALEKAECWPPHSGPEQAPRARQNVVYLCWGDESGNQNFGQPFDHEYLTALRSAGEHLNLDLAVVVYVYMGKGLRLVAPPGASATVPKLCERTVGFLVRTTCPRDVCPDILPLLERHGKPIAVLDEAGSPSLPDFARRNRLLKVFRPTISEASGESMARHLVAMGHRHVAAISPYRDAIWSRNRLAGLADTFRRTDPDAVPVEYTVSMPNERRDQRLESRALGLLRRSLHRTPEWKTPLPALKGIVARLRSELHQAARRERILEALEPCLESALKRKDLTAWVAIDDETAMLVLDFLGRRGLQVPRDVSLVGFDDTAEGARRDLTSYNFDFERINHYILRFLLDPSRTERAESDGLQRPEGRVVKRGSVRRRLPRQ